MSDQPSVPGGSGDELSSESDVLDEAREAALMREVMRTQKKHREGGVDPELDRVDTDPEPDA